MYNAMLGGWVLLIGRNFSPDNFTLGQRSFVNSYKYKCSRLSKVFRHEYAVWTYKLNIVCVIMAKNSEINLIIILLGQLCFLIITEGKYNSIILISSVLQQFQ